MARARSTYCPGTCRSRCSRRTVVKATSRRGLADVQIYNRALNATEIGQIKTAPAAVTSGLLGFWPLMGGLTDMAY